MLGVGPGAPTLFELGRLDARRLVEQGGTEAANAVRAAIELGRRALRARDMRPRLKTARETLPDLPWEDRTPAPADSPTTPYATLNDGKAGQHHRPGSTVPGSVRTDRASCDGTRSVRLASMDLPPRLRRRHARRLQPAPPREVGRPR